MNQNDQLQRAELRGRQRRLRQTRGARSSQTAAAQQEQINLEMEILRINTTLQRISNILAKIAERT